MVDQRLIEQAAVASRRLLTRLSFIDYVRAMQPGLIIEEPHLLIADAVERAVLGLTDRVMVFMPPRAGKTEFIGKLLPSYWMGLFPSDKIMQISYASRLARRSGRTVRNMLRSPNYMSRYPDVRLARDASAADTWNTQQGGEYLSAGIESGIAGQGWNLGLIDDPLSEQDAFSEAAKTFVHDWYGQGFYSRRQPERNVIFLVSTRWATDDLPGYLLDLAAKDPEADQWEVIKVPALLDRKAAVTLRTVAATHPSKVFLPPGPDQKPVVPREGDSFAPRRWTKENLLRQKRNMTTKAWEALYQQSPTKGDGNILMRQWWKEWTQPRLPECEFLMQVYDTAFEQGEENSYTARTTWGVFAHSDTGDQRDERFRCILLERYKQRPTFPELRKEAVESYQKWKPDVVLIEKKASGHSLIQELRRANVPARAWSPEKGLSNKSKVARAHAAAVMLEQGAVYYVARNWASEVIEDCAKFPTGDSSDIPDTCTMAWLYLRKLFYLQADGERIDPDYEPPLDRVSSVEEDEGRRPLYS